GPSNPSPYKRWQLIGALLLFSLGYSLVPSEGPYSAGAIGAWLGCIAAFLLVTTGGLVPMQELLDKRHLPTALRHLLSRPHLIALIGVLLLATILRFFNLEHSPPLFHGDEGEMGLDALAIVLGRPDAPLFFGTGFLEHPSLHFYLEALSINLFGVTIFALRGVTAVWGVVGVLATYIAGRTLLNRRIGLLAAVVAATAPVDLQLSRVSLNNVETVVLGTLAITVFSSGVLLVAGPQSEQGDPPFWTTGAPFRFGVAGVFTGLSLYFYFGSRVVPIILAAILAYALLRWREQRRPLLHGGAVTLAGLLIVLLPLLLYYVRNPQNDGSSRAAQYFLFAHLPDAEKLWHVQSVQAVVLLQMRATLAQFFTQPDSSSFFPFQAPILIAPAAGLFACGMLLVVCSLRRAGSIVLFLWFWAIFFAGGVLTLDAPYTPRIVGLLPAVYLMVALSLDWFLQTAAKTVSANVARLLAPLVALVLIAMSVSSVHAYFSLYFAADPNPPQTAVATYVAALPLGTYVYDLPDGLFFAYGSTRYLAYRIAGEDLQDPPANVRTLAPKSGQIAFIVFPRWASLLPVIEQRFPGGHTQAVMDGSQLVFTGYLVRVSPSTPAPPPNRSSMPPRSASFSG
ncbi:MAG TPA: glycosyltransferase family 39 protein, partial [Chloroflexota bacterium]